MAGRAQIERKVVLVILDGLGDMPIASLGGQTPLEAAATPVMDRLVEGGSCGLVDPLEPGVVVETHAGTGTLMGLEPSDAGRLARGPIEAAGAGLGLVPGDVALRCNFAHVAADDGGLAILDRRAGRILEGVADLASAVNALAPTDDVTTFLQPLGQHRAVLRLSGQGLSADVTDTDPGTGGEPQRLETCRATTTGDAAAVRTAAVINPFLERAHAVLDVHPVNAERVRRGLPPANGLLTRGAGYVQAVKGLMHTLGLRGAVVAGDRTVLGLAALLGLTPIVDPAFTALLVTDLDAKIDATLRALETHDVVWIHFKGTDIAAHDMQPQAKRDYIERVDAALGRLLEHDLVIGVAADHTTDSNTGCHTSAPVPALLHVAGGRSDDRTTFGERACKGGGLGRLPACDFLRALLRAAGAHLPTPAALPDDLGAST